MESTLLILKDAAGLSCPQGSAATGKVSAFHLARLELEFRSCGSALSPLFRKEPRAYKPVGFLLLESLRRKEGCQVAEEEVGVTEYSGAIGCVSTCVHMGQRAADDSGVSE